MFRFTKSGLDSIDRLVEAATRNGVLTVALHGDYRYDALRIRQMSCVPQTNPLPETLTCKVASSQVNGRSSGSRSALTSNAGGLAAPGWMAGWPEASSPRRTRDEDAITAPRCSRCGGTRLLCVQACASAGEG